MKKILKRVVESVLLLGKRKHDKEYVKLEQFEIFQKIIY
jgi:hypothetical protein